MAKSNQTAQSLMKKHGKSEIYAVGNHLYFDKRNALITANGDEGKVETIKADESALEEDEDENGPVNGKGKGKGNGKGKSTPKKTEDQNGPDPNAGQTLDPSNQTKDPVE